VSRTCARWRARRRIRDDPHGTPLDSAFIGEQITCAESILSGACKGEPYPNTHGVAARVCSYKRASIAFDPENVRAK